MGDTPIRAENYLAKRVNEQLEWYGKKSRQNKARYQLLRLLQISLGIVVGAGGVYAESIPHGTVLLSICGALISLSAAWETVFDYQNNWVRYRRVKEELKREKLLYENSSGPYRNPSADNDPAEATFTLFVERVERLLGDEVEGWTNEASKPSTDPPKSAST